MKKRNKWSKAGIAAVLFAAGCVVCFPFLWMILSSFKTDLEIAQAVPTFFPEKPTTGNFQELFESMDFGMYLKNTLLITLYSYLSLLFNSMAGYAFAKYEFKGKHILFSIVLATMMIPAQVTMIPMYMILNSMGLTNTFTGIVLPSLAGAFAIFLFRQFISTISDDFLEAGRMDGAGELYLYFRIVLPLTKPILSLQVILTFVSGWNAFLWPLIMASDEKYYTLSVGLSLLQNMYAQKFGLMMAGATVMIVPVILVYALFQKQIIRGISLSSYK